MDYIEVTGKTVEDARTEALIKLGTTSDQIEVEILEKGSSEEPMTLFEQFAGRKPDDTAFKKGRGLID